MRSQLAFLATKNNSTETGWICYTNLFLFLRKTRHSWVLRYNFDKVDGRVLLAPMLRFAISSALSNPFFLKVLTGIFPFDRWGKPLCVKGRQNYPARSPRWLARNIFFWPIRGTDFDSSGTRLVRKSAQGLFSPWNKLSRQKCRSQENIASSRLVAPGSPRMDVHLLRICFLFYIDYLKLFSLQCVFIHQREIQVENLG